MSSDSHTINYKRRWVVWKRERDGYKRDKFQGESQRNELCEAGLIQKDETPVAAQYRLELTLRDAKQSEELANTILHQKEQALEAQLNVVREASIEKSEASKTHSG